MGVQLPPRAPGSAGLALPHSGQRHWQHHYCLGKREISCRDQASGSTQRYPQVYQHLWCDCTSDCGNYGRCCGRRFKRSHLEGLTSSYTLKRLWTKHLNLWIKSKKTYGQTGKKWATSHKCDQSGTIGEETQPICASWSNTWSKRASRVA